MTAPNIRITAKGEVLMKPTGAAEEAKRKYRSRPTAVPLPPLKSSEDIERDARDALQKEGVDYPDEVTLLGQHKIQRGQYYGQTFRWVIENDAGYAFYLWREHTKGPSPGKTELEAKRATDNLAAFVRYLSSFEICKKTHEAIVAGQSAAVKAKEMGDPGLNMLGFGKYYSHTYKDMVQSTEKEHVRYCKWVRAKTGLQHGSSMHRFQQYLRTNPNPESAPSSAPTVPSALSKQQQSKSSDPPIPSTSADESFSWQKIVSPAQEKWMRKEMRLLGLLPGTAEYLQQSKWIGQPLWRTPPPGELQIRNPRELPTPESFWLHPMFVWCPEVTFTHLLGTSGLPCVTPGCNGRAEKRGLGRPRVVVGTGGGSTGMPNTGQYYILASTLHCKKCKCSPWAADQPAYLKMLPQSLQNLFPAVMTYRKAVCKSLVDQLRRSGRSPGDMSKEIEELLQLRYERAHNQYLHLLRTVRDQAQSGGNLDRAAGMDLSTPSIPFGDYADPKGYRGVSVSVQFLAGVLITEYEEQKPYLYGLMKGIFGRYWRADHTRTLASKVELLSGVMWSFCTFNEFWEVVSWVMVDSDSEAALANHYAGLARRYETADVTKAAIRWVDKWCCVAPPYSSKQAKDSRQEALPPCTTPNNAGVLVCVDRSTVTRQSACRTHYNEEMVELLDSFHCIRRFAKACTSSAHPAYPRFMSLLSSAFFIVDRQDLENLKKARKAVGAKGDPSKKEIRKHCRTIIPEPPQLETRVEAVIDAFRAVEDSNGIPLFKDNMINEWKLQRIHIRRGCLSDPRICPVADDESDDAGGVLYRLVDHVHFRGVASPATRLPVWQPLRGTSQLEGFHPHQAKWVTGTRVSPALFQAQAFLGLARWNWMRGTEYRKLTLPAFDPRLTAELNQAHVDEYAELKYPDFRCNSMETGEVFGIEYSQEVASITSMNESDVHIQYTGAPTTQDDTDMGDFEIDLETQEELEQMLASPREKFTPPKSPAVARVTKTGASAASPSVETTSTFTPSVSSSQSQGPDVNLPSAPSSSPRPPQQTCGDTASTHSSSTGGSPRDTLSDSGPVPDFRRNTLSGMVTNWHHDKWTPAMVTVINNLLAEHTGKDRMERVVTEYRKLVYAGSTDDSSQLRMTNRHFIQLYERELNRRMEGHASVNFSEEQTARVGNLTTQLGETDTVPTHIVSEEDAPDPDNIEQVPAPDDPYQKKRPVEDSGSSDDEETQHSLVTEVTQAVIAQLGLSKKSKQKKKSKKSKKHKRSDVDNTPSSEPVSRKCSSCGRPKSKVKGAGNLHHTYIRKGHPAFFYCPTKYANIYGTPETMTFAEFKTSEFWLPAVEAIEAEKRVAQERKAAAAKMREEKGWKKPGGPSKKK